MTQVRMSDEMASVMGLSAGTEHSREDVGTAALRRFSTDAGASVSADVLAELVVLLDAVGCEDLDTAVATACAVGEAPDDDGRASVHSAAERICGEVALRRHAP